MRSAGAVNMHLILIGGLGLAGVVGLNLHQGPSDLDLNLDRSKQGNTQDQQRQMAWQNKRAELLPLFQKSFNITPSMASTAEQALDTMISYDSGGRVEEALSSLSSMVEDWRERQNSLLEGFQKKMGETHNRTLAAIAPLIHKAIALDIEMLDNSEEALNALKASLPGQVAPVEAGSWERLIELKSSARKTLASAMPVLELAEDTQSVDLVARVCEATTPVREMHERFPELAARMDARKQGIEVFRDGVVSDDLPGPVIGLLETGLHTLQQVSTHVAELGSGERLLSIALDMLGCK